MTIITPISDQLGPEFTGLDLAAYVAADPLERRETTGPPRELVRLERILL